MNDKIVQQSEDKLRYRSIALITLPKIDNFVYTYFEY